ncbi:hypothetical protein X975_07120, partial [Stegodyphus mimosarum]
MISTNSPAGGGRKDIPFRRAKITFPSFPKLKMIYH